MNIVKNCLVFGTTLCFINLCNASNNNNINVIDRNVLVSGTMELSNHDTIINKSLEVQNNNFSSRNNSTLAEIRFGKSNKEEGNNNTTKVKVNGRVIQNINGHVHLFNHMEIQEGATLYTTRYNPNHVSKKNNKSIVNDSDLSNKNTAGFDIDSGILKFKEGSNIMPVNNIKDNNCSCNDIYPALYLCNSDSKLDISEVLKSTYNSSKSGQETQQQFKAHIVGTTDEHGNRQGIVDIFSINDNMNSFLSGISNQLEKFGSNDVLCENVKINIPLYKFQVVKKNGEILRKKKQVITVNSLEPAILISKENGSEIYDTVNKTDKIIGIELNIADKNFISDNIIELLKNNYLDNSNPNYTLIKHKDNKLYNTGIKIIPPINSESISNVFTESPESSIVNIKRYKANNLISFQDFVKSISSSNDNTLRLTLYKKITDNKYKIYTDFLNDQKYTLDLDHYSKKDNILPFKINNNTVTEESCIDMTGLSENQNSILPLYVNLKGELPITWKLPPNQINEIDFFGNNTKFYNTINLNSNIINKLVFSNNSFVKTNITNNIPVIWKFIGSNYNIIQDNNSYSANINIPLSCLEINNSNEEQVQIQLNNDKNKSAFNSYLYMDEVYITSSNQNKNSNDFRTSLIISDNVTIRLVNKEYKKTNPSCYIIPRNIILEHINDNFIIHNYVDGLDSKAKYYPTSKFIEVTKSLQDQLNNIATSNINNIGLYISIPNLDSDNLPNKIDLILVNDNASNKLQFDNMIEYIYYTDYNNANINKENTQDFNTNPHIYMPLVKLQYENINYYYITTFEVFPNYTRDLLKTNFNNAIKNGKLSKSHIIPNIYINGEKKTLNNDDILFDNDNNRVPYGEYLIFTESIQQDKDIEQ